MKRKRHWRCMIVVYYYKEYRMVHRTLLLACRWHPMKQLNKTQCWIGDTIKTNEYTIVNFEITREGRR